MLHWGDAAAPPWTPMGPPRGPLWPRDYKPRNPTQRLLPPSYEHLPPTSGSLKASLDGAQGLSSWPLPCRWPKQLLQTPPPPQRGGGVGWQGGGPQQLRASERQRAPLIGLLIRNDYILVLPLWRVAPPHLSWRRLAPPSGSSPPPSGSCCSPPAARLLSFRPPAARLRRHEVSVDGKKKKKVFYIKLSWRSFKWKRFKSSN